ncbi:VOC family protein [Lysobacter sp. CFH 32150]|uniref:VOC family protein n=1 Tax=Lysobacter sp. CFH 32150 TaxID=2927128 RepID=UPI001FA7225F|nr:VOC family protein [Lysobacter sp. CFH 32150]MCI4567829.1 VOC family protein [Lysobacter sp. CFH 32150]
MAVQTPPTGYHSVTPYLIVDNAAKAIDFYQKALNAKELYRLPVPADNGVEKIGHAEIKIGDSQIMLSDEYPEMNARGPNALGGTPTSFMIYVPDVDKAYDQAIKAGAKADRPVENQFWGDRTGTIVDPFGHKWTLGTHVEDVPQEELQKRMLEWSKKQQTTH